MTAAEVTAAELDARRRKHNDARRHVAMNITARDAAASISSLTPRQREVLEWAAAGLSTAEIAWQMGIGVPTVETHRRRAVLECGAETVGEVLVLAAKAGLV